MRVKVTCGLRISGCIGVGANFDIALSVGPFHQRLERILKCGFLHRNSPQKNLTRGAIDGHNFTFFKDTTVLQHQLLLGGLEADVGYANDTWQANAAPNHSRVAGHAAPFGQNGAGGMHPTNVFG